MRCGALRLPIGTTSWNFTLWQVCTHITVGHSGTHSVEHAFFDAVHQRFWLFAVGIGRRSEHLLSVDPETNTYKKIEWYSLAKL